MVSKAVTVWVPKHHAVLVVPEQVLHRLEPLAQPPGRLAHRRFGGLGGVAQPFGRLAGFVQGQVALLPAYEPWMTGTLVYSEPFWAHDCVGLRD